MAQSEVVEAFSATLWGAAEDVGEEADAGLLVGAEIGFNEPLCGLLNAKYEEVWKKLKLTHA